jgi:hypothetical protein
MVKYLTFTSKENIIYMYLLVLSCFVTVLHSPEVFIHCIRVLSSIYNYYISNISTQIICFASCLKISGPGVGPDPALTLRARVRASKNQPAPGQCSPLAWFFGVSNFFSSTRC